MSMVNSKYTTTNAANTQASGVNYRHTDNINLWIAAMRNIGLPEV